MPANRSSHRSLIAISTAHHAIRHTAARQTRAFIAVIPLNSGKEWYERYRANCAAISLARVQEFLPSERVRYHPSGSIGPHCRSNSAL
jgi:hypothetical protein